MDDLTVGLMLGNAKRTAAANTAIVQRNSMITELQSQIAALKRDISVKEAHAEGLTAQLRGFIAAHQDSPERALTGKTYKDGSPKNVGRIRYEEAFDASLVSNGIFNPAEYRHD